MRGARVLLVEFILLLGVCHVVAAADFALDGKRLMFNDRTWVYLDPSAPDTKKPALIFISRSDHDGSIHLETRDFASGAQTSNGTLRLNADGTIAELDGSLSAKTAVEHEALTFQYDPDNVAVSVRSDSSSARRTFPRTMPVLTASSLFFLIGGFNLDPTGRDSGVRMLMASPTEIRDMEFNMKLVRNEQITTAAGSFDTYTVEMSIGGIVGLFAPKITAWIDYRSHMLVRVALPDNVTMDLVEIR